MPYQDDATTGKDSNYKLNHKLYDTKTRFGEGSSSMLLPLIGDREILQTMITAYFEKAELISSGILHAMAAAQIYAQDSTAHVDYRGTWGDQFKYIGLRVLSYHPGPQKKASEDVIMTTARHTDATWLTMLWNDDNKGLHIRSGERGSTLAAFPPTQGALLINTGNVMSKASKNFFKSVCHWVVRTPETETKTRVSMPFFYDRLDDTGGPGFWNHGTGGC